jgi:glycosyltransferase involved in cell wall biosynthesis
MRRIGMFQSGDFRHVDENQLKTLHRVLAASHPQLDNLKKQVFLNPVKWGVIENGVDFQAFAATRTRVRKIPGRVIHNASPDRGLHHLLAAWPRIKTACPNASLRIFYGLDHLFKCFSNTNFAACTDPDLRVMYHRIKYIEEVLPKLRALDVEVMGGVSRNRIMEEECKAEVLAYPCDTIFFCECYPTSILECCAAGARVVTTDTDSLPGIFREVADIVPRTKLQTEFADHVIEALRGIHGIQPELDFAAGRDNTVMVSEWDNMLKDVMR